MQLRIYLYLRISLLADLLICDLNEGGEVRHASPEGTLSETMTSSAENYEDSGAWQENGTADGKRLSYCDDIYDEHKR